MNRIADAMEPCLHAAMNHPASLSRPGCPTGDAGAVCGRHTVTCSGMKGFAPGEELWSV